MNQGQYVFSQLVSHLDRNHFNYLACKYDGNKYVKHFSCWNHLLAMMFGQLSNRESLRDVVVALEAHHSKCKFLGIGSKPIAKTTLASANQNRDYRIFEDFAFYMMKEACEKRATNLLDIPGKKYAFDSTTIPLCLSTFPWARFRRKKGGVKAHVLYDIEAQVPAFYTVTTASKHDSTEMSSIPYEPNAYYIFDRAYDSFKELYRIHLTDSFYVVRAKTNLKYKMVKWKRRMPKNVLTDAEVKLTVYLSEKKYPESFRLIRYYDEEEEREFTFLTNAKQLTALEVAELYKKRWLVELFFKWLKQHLKIKKFWGTTENAVRIQILLLGKAYALVFENVVSPIKYAFSIDNLVGRLTLLPDDEESTEHVDAIESGEVKIASVKHIARQRLVCEPFHRVDIMYLCIGNPIEHGYLSNNVNLSMDSDARLGAPELCPSEYGHAQVDGSGIDGIEPTVQLKLLCNAFGLSNGEYSRELPLREKLYYLCKNECPYMHICSVLNRIRR